MPKPPRTRGVDARRRRSPDSPAALSETLLAVHRMSMELEAWPEAVQRIVDWVGADKALLFSPTTLAASLPAVPLGLDPAILKEYADQWHDQDIWTVRLDQVQALHTPRVIRGEEFVPHSEFMSSSVYNECLRRSGVAKLLTSAVVPRGNNRALPVVVCSLYRGSESEDFGEAEQRRYELVLPHLVQALEGYWHWRGTDALQAIWRGAIGELGAGVLLVDDQDRVVTQTDRATELLRQYPVLSTTATKLVAQGHPSNRPLLAAALSAAAAGRPMTVRFESALGKPQLIASVAPVPEQLRGTVGLIGIRAMLLLRPVEDGTQDTLALLRSAFALTPTETRVLGLLIEGHAPAAIGEQLRVGVATIRTHLKRIYSKTETHSQRELLSLARKIGTAGVPRGR